jgi:hypothetical protein
MLLPVEADKGNDMILSTMNDLPGYEVTEVIGEVFGITVQSDLRLRPQSRSAGEATRMTVDRKGGNSDRNGPRS